MSQNFDLDQTPSPSSPDVSEMGEEVTLKTYARGDKIGGRYEVYEVITHGGMGDIYFCLDLEEDLPLALKTFKPRLIAKNPRIRDLFYQEVSTWVGLEKHPNIVRCYYLDYLDNLPFMFLEWIADPDRERTDLAYWLRKRGPLDLRLALNITIDICRGLSHATQKKPGLVHRDLKPANILIDQEGIAVITDFGLATLVPKINFELVDLPLYPNESQSLLQLGSFVGTPAYAAPEHWDAPDKVDSRADIYAIGCILYEMLTGKRPFEIDFKLGSPGEKSVWLENWRVAHEQTSLSLPKEWPDEVREVVWTCLQKEREQRFPRVEEMLQEIEAIYQRQFEEVCKAIIISPDFTAMDYNNRGNTYNNLHQYEKALKDFAEAIRLAPESAPFYSNRGNTYHHLQRYEEALIDYSQAIRLDPGLAMAYHNRAVTYSALQRYEEALTDYSYAIQLNPDDYTKCYTKRGHIYVKLCQYQDALIDYSQAIQFDPNEASLYSMRGAVYVELQRYEEALADYSLSIRLNPNYVEAFINRGAVYFELEQDEKAFADFFESIRLDPDLAIGYNNIGALFHEQDKLEKALYYLEKAVQLGLQQAAKSITEIKQELNKETKG